MTANRSCRFEPSSPFYGRFSIQKWPFFGCFQDNCLRTIVGLSSRRFHSTLLFLHND